MQHLIIHLRSQSASFRDPEFQSYQKSYALPAPTTVIGMIGAAKGLNPLEAQEYFFKHNFKLGCYGVSNGFMKDMWKFNDYKLGSVVLREFFINYQLYIAVGSKDRAALEALKDAFYHPVFALSLGNSDSVAKLIDAKIVGQDSTHNKLAHCWAEGDIINAVLENATLNKNFSIFFTSDSITYDMPTKFSYEAEGYGTRKVAARKKISVVTEDIVTNMDVSGIYYEDIFIPTFHL